MGEKKAGKARPSQKAKSGRAAGQKAGAKSGLKPGRSAVLDKAAAAQTALPGRSAAPLPVRVGTAGIPPMMVIGLATLFEGSPTVTIVQDGILELLRDMTLTVLLVGAPSDAALQELMANVSVYRSDVRMLVFSPATTEEAILRILAAGAKGHLHDAASITEIEQAVQIVASGSIWAPRRVLAMLIERLTLASPDRRRRASAQLTQREREVMELLLAGHPNKAIANAMRIDEQTVKAYVSRLMRKVGVKSRTALTMHAVENAWLETTP
jgi:DNA-binding NarL/FixJ family response regulator